MNNNKYTGIWKQVLFFALPIAATSMLEQLFNSADVAVVGKFANASALAAVGSTSAVVNLYVAIFTGLAVGANVLVAQMIGAKKEKEIIRAVHTSLVIAVISGVLLTLAGFFASEPILEVMGTPADIIDAATSYLRVYSLGAVFMMLYNFEAAIMRANGDTKRPLYCLLFSGVCNVVLNLFFVIVCHMDVVGVAAATVLSNATSAGLLFYFLRTEENAVQVILTDIRIDKNSVKIILRLGIPAAIQGVLFSVANILIQTGVNQLGSNVIAASTIGLNAELFVYYLMNSFGQAAVTFNGQNLGARDLKSCARFTFYCIIMGEIVTMSLVAIILLFRVPFAQLYANDASVVALAQIRLIGVLIFEMFNVMFEVLSGALRGLGYSTVPAGVSAVFICGVRMIWIFFIFPSHHTFRELLIVYPTSWIVACIAVGIAYLSVQKRVAAKFKIETI